jgi:hypothetical protein
VLILRVVADPSEIVGIEIFVNLYCMQIMRGMEVEQSLNFAAGHALAGAKFWALRVSGQTFNMVNTAAQGGPVHHAPPQAGNGQSAGDLLRAYMATAKFKQWLRDGDLVELDRFIKTLEGLGVQFAG